MYGTALWGIEWAGNINAEKHFFLKQKVLLRMTGHYKGIILEEKDKSYTFWVVVDEEGDIVNVNHPIFGEMKAVFTEKGFAEKALEVSVMRDPCHSQWQVLAANIVEED